MEEEGGGATELNCSYVSTRTANNGSQPSQDSNLRSNRGRRSNNKKGTQQKTFLNRIIESASQYYGYVRNSAPVSFFFKYKMHYMMAFGSLAAAYYYRN